MIRSRRVWQGGVCAGICLMLGNCAGPGGSGGKPDPATGTASDWDQPARRLTDSSSDQLAPAFSADGRALIYQNNSDGNWELYFLDLADGRPQRITDSPEAEEDPSWSPDGRWILCTVHVPTLDADPPREILLLDREGKQGRILAAHGADDWFPRFDPDGRSVIFLSDRVDERRDLADEERQCALFRVNLEDGGLTQLSEPGRLGSPVPGARGVALRLGPHSLGWLGTQGLETSLVDSSLTLGHPDWHENKGWAVATLQPEQGGQLGLRGNTATGWTLLALEGREADMSPVWSPDGAGLAFAGRSNGQWDLYLRGTAGVVPKP